MSANKTEIDFVLVGKNKRKYLRDVKAISWKLQDGLVTTERDKKKLKFVLQKN